MAFSIRLALGVAALTAAAGASPLTGQGTPAPAPAPQLTVGGVAYGQYVYQLGDTAGHQNNFDVTRGYVNLIGKFAGGVYTRVTLDLFSLTNTAATNNENGSYSYRLKYAYVAWTPEKSPLTYKLGMIHTPWLDWEEALWDYRMQGQMAMERAGTIAPIAGGAYLTSSDLGFGIDGKAKDDQVNAQVTLVNGEGYHGGVGDKRKDLEGRLSVRVLGTNDNSRVGGLRLTAYGQYGKPTGGGIRNRALVMVSYRSKELTLAAEAAVTVDSLAAATVRSNGHVYSAFGVFHIPQSKATIIARADILKPQVAVANNQTTRIIGGVSYQVSANLRALLDWDFLGYQATPTPAQVTTRSQGLVQIQFTF
jgi:hypothetical protein